MRQNCPRKLWQQPVSFNVSYQQRTSYIIVRSVFLEYDLRKPTNIVEGKHDNSDLAKSKLKTGWKNICDFNHWSQQHFKTHKQMLFTRQTRPHVIQSGWWKKSCTSWLKTNPSIYKVLYIPGGAGFLPSTVVWRCFPIFQTGNLTQRSRHSWRELDIIGRNFPNRGSHLVSPGCYLQNVNI